MNSQSRGQSITLRGVGKSWGSAAAVNGIDIDVAAGTFTVLLGPSGCGKSTTLRIIAGLESADRGDVLIGGRDVSGLPPARRDVAMVFQSYALFPHLNVAENILFGLKVRRTARAEQRRRLAATAEMLGLSPYLQRKPNQLSGGQQQRVALGRAIIAEKSICLMDEPLSNLDAKLRNAMRSEIRELQQKLGFTMVYVTHDQAEAITMADQVVLLNNGRVEQADTPRAVYQRPASAFVAGFIGTPPMNLIDAEVFFQHLLAGDSAARSAHDGQGFGHGFGPGFGERRLRIGVRPESLRVGAGAGLAATVAGYEYLGADTLVDCRVGDTPVLARVAGPAELSAGDRVSLSWNPEDSHFFAADNGARVDQARLDGRLFGAA